jgi:transposase-like protein
MNTLKQIEAAFPDEDSCRAYLVKMRWPAGVHCPRCGSEKVHKLSRPWNWQCKQCTKAGYRFSPLVGTVFENTNYPLRTWFRVIFLMCQSKKGMSALQIHRMIGSGSYRTAWYMCHRIRAAMKEGGGLEKLTGTVEIDETFVGGKGKNKHRSAKFIPKTAVIGAISRKGNVVARVIERVDRETVESFMAETVSTKVDLIASDESTAYNGLVKRGFSHATVNHSRGEYVRGLVHTANIDSFWSLLKRGIMGSFHHVSKKYLPLYVDEFSFRFNQRKASDIFEQVIAGC